jgi:hypothetical protein
MRLARSCRCPSWNEDASRAADGAPLKISKNILRSTVQNAPMSTWRLEQAALVDSMQHRYICWSSALLNRRPLSGPSTPCHARALTICHSARTFNEIDTLHWALRSTPATQLPIESCCPSGLYCIQPSPARAVELQDASPDVCSIYSAMYLVDDVLDQVSGGVQA